MQKHPFKLRHEVQDLAKVNVLEVPVKLSISDQIDVDSKPLIACNVYNKRELSTLYYVLLDDRGDMQVFKEEAGILPTLFKSPAETVYVSLVPYHPDKELEISIPLFRDADFPLPPGKRPFLGDYIGISGDSSIFHYVNNWSDTKPDILMGIAFKNGRIQRKKQVKLPLPRKNIPFINQGEIHLVGREENVWIHRQVDTLGQELRRRTLPSMRIFYRAVISMSFEGDSYLLAQDAEGAIVLDIVQMDGSINSVQLLDLGEPFYNVWKPVRIGAACYVVQFNAEHGNGWFTMRGGKLLEFFYSKDTQGYKDLLTNACIHLAEPNLISGICKTGEMAYAVVLYTGGAEGAKQIQVLHRQL